MKFFVEFNDSDIERMKSCECKVCLKTAAYYLNKLDRMKEKENKDK